MTNELAHEHELLQVSYNNYIYLQFSCPISERVSRYYILTFIISWKKVPFSTHFSEIIQEDTTLAF